MSCEPQALRALGALKRRRRGATLLGRARARQPPERSDRPDLRGGAVELSGHDDSLKPGHGRLALAAGQASSGGERNGRSPGFKPLLAGYETSSRSPQPRASGVVNPAARGRSVAHTTERTMRGMRPSLGERGGRPDPLLSCQRQSQGRMPHVGQVSPPAARGRCQVRQFHFSIFSFRDSRVFGRLLGQGLSTSAKGTAVVKRSTTTTTTTTSCLYPPCQENPLVP